jgi:REP-associated tyrosine transposase
MRVAGSVRRGSLGGSSAIERDRQCNIDMLYIYRPNHMKRWRQQEFKFRTRGGSRPRAGRKRRPGRGRVAHRARPEHKKAHPIHVTLSARRQLPSLRKQSIFSELRRALACTARTWFRVVHFSVQADHAHLLVEADDKVSLSRGLRGVAIRLARALNRVARRQGKVWDDRYHARSLKTPREVRHGIVYVLMNWKKHVPGVKGFDPCSSALSFAGWIAHPSLGPPHPDERVELPATWLLRTGWRRHGLLAMSERPRVSLVFDDD